MVDVSSAGSVAKVTPSEEQVTDAARNKLDDSPGLGITKLLVFLQESNGWSLSEKRLKSILAAANLRRQGPASSTTTTNKKNGSSPPAHVPLSHLDTHLNIPPGVRAVYFDSVKGKGLMADREYKEGETIFTEDAFVASPPSHAMKQLLDGELCAQCFAPLNGSLIVRCGQKDCSARFCTRLCQSRAQTTHHALLCPGQNPSIKPFNRFLSIQKWLSLALVSKMIARILLTHSNHAPESLSASSSSAASATPRSARDEPPRATVEEMLAHSEAFATVSELERRARNPGWEIEKPSFLAGMKEAHTLLCQGLDPRLQSSRKGKWPLWNDFPKPIADRLFSWDSFVCLLGRANLNSEAQGGMYLVHSHLNHSCSPNVVIRHPPSRYGVRQATRITAIAKRSIAKDEELLITYQDPQTPLVRRRMLLWRDYMFGPCACTRCEEELAALPEGERKEIEQGSWMRDAKEEADVGRRKEHADMLKQLEQERDEKLKSEGKDISQQDMKGIEEELRSHLGF